MAKKLNQEEFESLVNEIKGDCDKCKLDLREQLRWMDSIVESLRYQLAKALAMNRVLLKAANLIAEDDYLEREIKRLTAKILKQEVRNKGPQSDDDEKDLNKKLSDWN